MFDANSPWSSLEKSRVSLAFATLNGPKDHDGSALVNVHKVDAWAAVLVGLQHREGSDSLGEYSCVFNNIWLNSAYSGYGAKFYWKVARHEMMHALSADHAGRADSRASAENPTTMSTCVAVSDFKNENFLDRDGEIQLQWIFNSLNTNHALNANIGFENGTSEWGGSNGSLSSVASGGVGGTKYLSFDATGTSSSSYVRQTLRLWTGDDTSQFRAVLAARAPSSAVNTNARASLYRKRMSEGSTSLGCGYARALTNPNSVTIHDAEYVLVSQSSLTNVGTSWTTVASPWTSLPKRDGWEFQTRAYGNAAGSYSIRFDNVRAEEK